MWQGIDQHRTTGAIIRDPSVICVRQQNALFVCQHMVLQIELLFRPNTIFIYVLNFQ